MPVVSLEVSKWGVELTGAVIEHNETKTKIGRHFANDIFKYIFLNENNWFIFASPATFNDRGQLN